MKLALVISANASRQAPLTALRFARAAVAEGHQLVQVFFFSEAALLGNHFCISPQDETDIRDAWGCFLSEQNIEGIICVSAALKRGVISEREAARYQKPGSNIDPRFSIAGLGSLAEAFTTADRLLHFG